MREPARTPRRRPPQQPPPQASMNPNRILERPASASKTCSAIPVLADEAQHALESIADLGHVGRVARLAVALEVGQLDVAAGVAVVLDEARRLALGALVILVLVVVH